MKYTKIFMALLMALFMVACSDDDDAINTNQITLGFEKEAIVVKENVGYFNVPIKIAGYRNGNVKVNVVATPVGENGAVEDVNYMITDKSLQLLSENDTTDNATLNIQIKTIDDQEINENRSFNLEITSAEGATITTKNIQITLRDNDAAFYEKFFGKWTLKYTVEGASGVEVVEKTMVISGPTDEDDPDYNNVLTATCAGMFNVGISLDASFRFNYTFDVATKKGTLGLIMGDLVASYGSSYMWTFVNFVYDAEKGDYVGGYEDYLTDWSLDENDAFPTTITFPTDEVMYMALYQPGGGAWRYVYNVSMTKQ